MERLTANSSPLILCPGPIHLAVGGASNDSLKVKVVLKSEQLWLHHTGCAPHSGLLQWPSTPAWREMGGRLLQVMSRGTSSGKYGNRYTNSILPQHHSIVITVRSVTAQRVSFKLLVVTAPLGSSR